MTRLDALTAATYHEVGGVREAIARSAEEVFTRLDLDEQRRARELLLRLITPGDGAPDTRRWVPLPHVRDGAASSAVLDRFAGRETARLVGHRGVVWGVAYSPDGRWLASTGNDQTDPALVGGHLR